MDAILTARWVMLDDSRLAMASVLLEGAEPGISADVWRQRMVCLRETGGGVYGKIEPSGYITACFMYEIQVEGEASRVLVVRRPATFAIAAEQSNDELLQAAEDLALRLGCTQIDVVLSRVRQLQLAAPDSTPVAGFMRDGFSVKSLILSKAVGKIC